MNQVAFFSDRSFDEARRNARRFGYTKFTDETRLPNGKYRVYARKRI